LAGRFWPGPFTLVLPKRAAVPDLVTAGMPTVAVRVPDHAAARELIRRAGTPIAAPSANLFGQVSPTTAGHVLEQLGGRIAAVLDAGPCRVGLESTILSLAGPAPSVLRPGAVTLEMLREALGRVELADQPRDLPQAPGQLARHYATRTPLMLLDKGTEPVPQSGLKVGLLAFRLPERPADYEAVALLDGDDPVQAAAGLFASLRALDGLGLDRIHAQTCAESGLGLAIMNRLRRCAAPEA
jgi:L-threonylcarbamoyladenylate synthase